MGRGLQIARADHLQLRLFGGLGRSGPAGQRVVSRQRTKAELGRRIAHSNQLLGGRPIHQAPVPRRLDAVEFNNMIGSWLRQWRRNKILAVPFPREWLRYLEKNVLQYSYLLPEEQTKLRDDVQVFVAEKNWEGCAG